MGPSSCKAAFAIASRSTTSSRRLAGSATSTSTSTDYPAPDRVPQTAGPGGVVDSRRRAQGDGITRGLSSGSMMFLTVVCVQLRRVLWWERPQTTAGRCSP